MTWRVRYGSLMWGVLLVLLRREAHCTSLHASSAGSQAPNLDCPAAKMAAGEQLRTPRCNARGARTVQLIPCKDGPQLWTMTMTMVWSQATPSYIMLDEKKGMYGGIGSNVIHYFVRSSFGSFGPLRPLRSIPTLPWFEDQARNDQQARVMLGMGGWWVWVKIIDPMQNEYGSKNGCVHESRWITTWTWFNSTYLIMRL